MKQPPYSVGIDLSSESFTVSIISEPGICLCETKDYDNNLEGFDQLTAWFNTLNLNPRDMIICMESTGVYGELLCHYLYEHKYRTAVDHPLKVERAFNPTGHKTDAVDSLQIAEYAIRFYDSLNIWEPKKAIVDKLKAMITTRELLVKHRTAEKNIRSTILRKKTIPKAAIAVLKSGIKMLSKNIAIIEKAMSELISSQPKMRQIVDILKTGPSVQELLATNVLVLTNGFTQEKTGNSCNLI